MSDREFQVGDKVTVFGGWDGEITGELAELRPFIVKWSGISETPRFDRFHRSEMTLVEPVKLTVREFQVGDKVTVFGGERAGTVIRVVRGEPQGWRGIAVRFDNSDVLSFNPSEVTLIEQEST